MQDSKNNRCTTPIISVIVPVYNVEQWLHECLESIVFQNATDYEVILVDDGSTDNSLDIITAYGEKYDFFHVFSKTNGGLSSARNYGIAKAKGKYLYFLDSDDKFFDDKCISFMIGELQNKEIDVLYFDGESFFESDVLKEQNQDYVLAYQRKESYGEYEVGALLFKELVDKHEYYPSACLACYRREYLKNNNMFFEEGYLYEDNYFSFKCMLLAGAVRHKARKVLARRIRKGSITQTNLTWKNLKGYLRAWLQMRKFWEDNPNNLAGETVGVVVNEAKSGTISTWQMLEVKEKEKIKELSQYEQHELTSILYKAHFEGKESYVFPYGFIRKNAKVVIYGAGEVGKAFYYQAVNSGMVQVVAWIDTNAVTMAGLGMPVLPIAALKEVVFDVVLISIENKDVADQVKNNLCNLGIPVRKIKWYGYYYRWNYAYRTVFSPLVRIMKQIANNGKRKFWLFMLPEHGNMGDYAIGYAAKDFLRKYFKDVVCIDVSEGEWSGLSKHIEELVQAGDVIFLNGGGDFGDLWDTGKAQHAIAETFSKNTIIFLPNTLSYQGEITVNNESLMNDMSYYGSKKNIHIFLRERRSYAFCSEHLDNVYCYPDMVLSSVVPRNNKGEERKALLCFRNDKEKKFNGRDRIKQILTANQWDFEEIDIHKMRYVSQEDGKAILREIICKMQSSEVVITDRLHGMLLSVISQVPCIAFDNSTKKISGVYAWFKDYPNVKLGEEKNIDLLMDWIKMVTLVPTDFRPLDSEFSKMAEEIGRIIG